MPPTKLTKSSVKNNARKAVALAEAGKTHLVAAAGTVVAKLAKAKKTGGGDLGFETTLWSAADQLRGSMDASEYKHPVLGLIFLKYISDAFEELRAELADDPEADPEDRDEYTARNVFWVPPDARWSQIAAKAKSPQIGEIVDKAMISLESDNPRLRGV